MQRAGPAEHLTGWPLGDALGQPLDAVFRFVSAQTRLPSLNPLQRLMQSGEVVALANHTALLSCGGPEYQIADNPIAPDALCEQTHTFLPGTLSAVSRREC